MKLHGKKIEGLNRETVVIPRSEGDDLVFIAEAVPDWQPFYKLCPGPKAPVRVLKGGKKEYDLEDPAYLAQLDAHGKKQTQWLILQSLKATPGLEWETVNLGDHRTWGKLEDELVASGLTYAEIRRIVDAVMNANCLNERRLEEALENFQRGQQAAPSPDSGQSTEPPST